MKYATDSKTFRRLYGNLTKDHVLYGPLMYTGEIIRVDLTTGSVSHVAGGFPRPSAVNLDSHGLIYVVDYFTGEVTRVIVDRKRFADRLPPR